MTQLKERIKAVIIDKAKKIYFKDEVYKTLSQEWKEEHLGIVAGISNELSEAIATDPEIKRLFKESDNDLRNIN